jgi:hypothetical protein
LDNWVSLDEFVALLGSVSAHKLVQRDPVVQEAENSFGDTRTAGRQIESQQKLTYRKVADQVPAPVPMKIQRDPAFTFSGPHPHYHSNSSTGNAGQAGEFANGGTLTKGALGA